MLRSRSQHRWCALCSPNCNSRRRKHVCHRSHRLPVVATSEFWWEDEQEFDALTEILPPKHVYITTPTAATQHMQQLKTSTKFAAAFTSPGIKDAADQIWQQLGRAGPPLFLKVRSRESLQQCEECSASSSSSNSNTAAEGFWKELTGQTWRTELDYGLAGTANDGKPAQPEQILVLVSSVASVQHLMQAAVAASSSNSSSSAGEYGTAVVSFLGWNQGETQQQLTSWRDQLKPVVQQLATV